MRPQTIVESVRVLGLTTVVTWRTRIVPGIGGLITMWRSLTVPSVSVVRRLSVIMITGSILKDAVHHPEDKDVIKRPMELVSVRLISCYST